MLAGGWLLVPSTLYSTVELIISKVAESLPTQLPLARPERSRALPPK